MARVGVCTRPQESCALCLTVSARVAFKPTSQSASALATAASYSFWYSRASLSWAKPWRMALSVTEEIHRRFMGFFTPAFLIIQRATNSPSRPASVAITMSLMSLRCIWALTAWYCLLVFLMTWISSFSGSMGRVSIFHTFHCSP